MYVYRPLLEVKVPKPWTEIDDAVDFVLQCQIGLEYENKNGNTYKIVRLFL